MIRTKEINQGFTRIRVVHHRYKSRFRPESGFFHVQIFFWYQTSVWTDSGQNSKKYPKFEKWKFEKIKNWKLEKRNFANRKFEKIQNLKNWKLRIFKFLIFRFFRNFVFFNFQCFIFGNFNFSNFPFFSISIVKFQETKSEFCPDLVQTGIWFWSGPDKIQILVWTRKIPDSGRNLD